MNRSRIVRRIRLAASMLCAALSILAATLWWRSYDHSELIRLRITKGLALSSESVVGLMGMGLIRFEKDSNATWSLSSSSVGGWRDYLHESDFRLVWVPGCSWGILVPHWFLVLLMASLAVSLGYRRYAFTGVPSLHTNNGLPAH
jgi:hypothetical protein